MLGLLRDQSRLGRRSQRGPFPRKISIIDLTSCPITLAPLRERAEDIPVLAHHFMDRYAKEAKKNFTEIVADALKQLCAYDWPGNVRELGNAIERAIVLGHGP